MRCRMRAISSRSILILSIVTACIVLVIAFWAHGFTFWLPLWLLQILLLCFVVWLMAREPDERCTIQTAPSPF